MTLTLNSSTNCLLWCVLFNGQSGPSVSNGDIHRLLYFSG